MRARFLRMQWENQSQTIGSFFFQPDAPFYFTPGQYTSFISPHDDPDKRGQSRTMTLTSLPSDKFISMTTKFIPGKSSSYKQSLLALQPGDAAAITDAMGDLVLPLDDSIPLVFVAGGVGIASYVSIIRWLAERHDGRDITLLYSVSRVGDILFQTDFNSYSDGTLRKILFTSDQSFASSQWSGEHIPGRITARHIMEYASPNAQIYLSGGESMVEGLHHSLEKDFGVPQYRLVFDFFDGYNDAEIA